MQCNRRQLNVQRHAVLVGFNALFRFFGHVQLVFHLLQLGEAHRAALVVVQIDGFRL